MLIWTKMGYNIISNISRILRILYHIIYPIKRYYIRYRYAKTYIFPTTVNKHSKYNTFVGNIITNSILNNEHYPFYLPLKKPEQSKSSPKDLLFVKNKYILILPLRMLRKQNM